MVEGKLSTAISSDVPLRPPPPLPYPTLCSPLHAAIFPLPGCAAPTSCSTLASINFPGRPTVSLSPRSPHGRAQYRAAQHRKYSTGTGTEIPALLLARCCSLDNTSLLRHLPRVRVRSPIYSHGLDSLCIVFWLSAPCLFRFRVRSSTFARSFHASTVLPRWPCLIAPRSKAHSPATDRLLPLELPAAHCCPSVPPTHWLPSAAPTSAGLRVSIDCLVRPT